MFVIKPTCRSGHIIDTVSLSENCQISRSPKCTKNNSHTLYCQGCYAGEDKHCFECAFDGIWYY